MLLRQVSNCGSLSSPGAPRVALIPQSTSGRASGSRKAAARHEVTGRSTTRTSNRWDRAHLTPSRRHPQRQRPPAPLRCLKLSSRCPHSTATPGPRPTVLRSFGPRRPF
ncbi:hypothetical protein NDU88_005232 [Pleurodeles waltl]|uniref:Uncharacterized protein n=1 Tax=Pleurodeles waltl TaxID=8319 RepID=A0AAV7PF42_PLEWA|nr:hypothetical protein NDU88_005232 [Pleurodeles waltl]